MIYKYLCDKYYYIHKNKKTCIFKLIYVCVYINKLPKLHVVSKIFTIFVIVFYYIYIYISIYIHI